MTWTAVGRTDLECVQVMARCLALTSWHLSPTRFVAACHSDNRHRVGRTSLVTNFGVATNEYRKGEEYTEYHSVVTWV